MRQLMSLREICEHSIEIHGIKKDPGPLLSPHAPFFIPIHVCDVINDDYVTEIMIMNFLKYNYPGGRGDD
jgi:hypothetical protein